METMGSMLCLMLTANGDTLLLAAGWTLGGGRLSKRATLVLSLVTSVLTAASLWAGAYLGQLFPAEGTKTAAALLMTGLGLWTLFRAVCGEEEMLHAPEPDTLRELVLLAAVLASNNVGMGIAGGAAGMPPAAGGVVNFLASLGCLRLGSWLGQRGAVRCSGQAADILSGLVLVLLGAGMQWL